MNMLLAPDLAGRLVIRFLIVFSLAAAGGSRAVVRHTRRRRVG
jgi:hypothetical protein